MEIRKFVTTCEDVLTEAYPEEEFWQGVMLGIEPEWSRRRLAQYFTYVVTVVAVFFIAFWKAKESLQ